MKTALKHTACLSAFLVMVSMAQANPWVFWASDPVRPDETVVVQGAAFGDAPTIEIGRVRDDAADAADLWPAVQNPRTVQPLQISGETLKFVIPADSTPGAFAFRVRTGDEVSPAVVLNAVDVWWMQGDESQYATPGGWVRIFGKCLATGGKTQVRLTLASGDKRVLPASGDDYGVRIGVPKDLAPGTYKVDVHNGCMGEAGWKSAGNMTLVPPVQWKQDIFKLSDFPGSPTAAMSAALARAKANGGGIVLVPRGRWELTQPIEIPPGTILQGESRELSSIFWQDFKSLPPALIHGADFGIKDLSIYAQSFKRVLSVDPGSRRLVLDNLLVRADNFFGLGEPGLPHNGRTAPTKVVDYLGNMLLHVSQPNFQITNCDLYTNEQAIVLDPRGFVEPDGPRFSGLIAGNRVCGGQGYYIDGGDGVIVENNEFFNSTPLSGGNTINTNSNNFDRHVYFGGNRTHDIYGFDQEMMTLDASGSAYYGKIAQAVGTTVTLPADPVFKDYGQHRSDYRGGVIVILTGTGAGQYRTVTANKGRQWTVDRPWVVPPDESSVITITHHRGRNIFQNNDFVDGGTVQLYGNASDSLVVGNRGRRMFGFNVWGGNQGGMGWQPSMNCQFLDNQILEGNGYGWRSAFIGTASNGIIASTITNRLGISQKEIDAQQYSGPLVRTAIFRRNKINSNGYFRIGGVVDNVLVENCQVRNSDEGVSIGKTATNVLLRNNVFENVRTPVLGANRASILSLPPTSGSGK